MFHKELLFDFLVLIVVIVAMFTLVDKNVEIVVNPS